MAPSNEETTPRKRATRKRTSSSAARKATTKRTVRKATRKATRKTTRKTVEDEVVRDEEMTSSSDRKAPTPLRAKKDRSVQQRNRLIVVGAILIVGVGSSLGVSFLDEGQIDVRQTIEARNERIANNSANSDDTSVTTRTVPVQNTNEGKANGGLIGLGTGGSNPPPVTVSEIASSTASSTDQTASSTDAVATSTESEIETVSTEAESEGSATTSGATI